jgi:hypothetical protein
MNHLDQYLHQLLLSQPLVNKPNLQSNLPVPKKKVNPRPLLVLLLHQLLLSLLLIWR